jgi:hypothetical protein
MTIITITVFLQEIANVHTKNELSDHLRRFAELIYNKQIALNSVDDKGQTILHRLIRSKYNKFYIREYIEEVFLNNSYLCLVNDLDGIYPVDIDSFYFKSFMILGQINHELIDSHIRRCIGLEIYDIKSNGEYKFINHSSNGPITYFQQNDLDFIIRNTFNLDLNKHILALCSLVPYNRVEFENTLLYMFDKININIIDIESIKNIIKHEYIALYNKLNDIIQPLNINYSDNFPISNDVRNMDKNNLKLIRSTSDGSMNSISPRSFRYSPTPFISPRKEKFIKHIEKCPW